MSVRASWNNHLRQLIEVLVLDCFELAEPPKWNCLCEVGLITFLQILIVRLLRWHRSGRYVE